MLAGISGMLGFIAVLVIWKAYEEMKRAAEYKKVKKEAARLENERRERLVLWADTNVNRAEENGVPAHVVATRILVQGWDEEKAVHVPERNN